MRHHDQVETLEGGGYYVLRSRAEWLPGRYWYFVRAAAGLVFVETDPAAARTFSGDELAVDGSWQMKWVAVRVDVEGGWPLVA